MIPNGFCACIVYLNFFHLLYIIVTWLVNLRFIWIRLSYVLSFLYEFFVWHENVYLLTYEYNLQNSYIYLKIFIFVHSSCNYMLVFIIKCKICLENNDSAICMTYRTERQNKKTNFQTLFFGKNLGIRDAKIFKYLFWL